MPTADPKPWDAAGTSFCRWFALTAEELVAEKRIVAVRGNNRSLRLDDFGPVSKTIKAWKTDPPDANHPESEPDPKKFRDIVASVGFPLLRPEEQRAIVIDWIRRGLRATTARSDELEALLKFLVETSDGGFLVTLARKACE